MSTDQAFNDLIREAAKCDPEILELGSEVSRTWGQVMGSPEELVQHIERTDRTMPHVSDGHAEAKPDIYWVSHKVPVGPESKPEMYHLRGIWRPRWIIFALFPSFAIAFLGLLAHFVAKAPLVGVGGSAHVFAYMAAGVILGLGITVDLARLVNSKRFRPIQ